jgi:tRNA G46 methylase TrmB
MTFDRDGEEQAQNWLAWARTPGHDVYWHYRSEFFALVAPAGRATLEIGCGEGRVARDLAARAIA